MELSTGVTVDTVNTSCSFSIKSKVPENTENMGCNWIPESPDFIHHMRPELFNYHMYRSFDFSGVCVIFSSKKVQSDLLEIANS